MTNASTSLFVPLGDLRVDISRIRNKFFAAGSKHAKFLDSFVQGHYSLKVTTEGVRGLPKVLRRGVVDSQNAKANLLFLDLPDPPSSPGAPIPDRFKVNVLLPVLENMQAQDLPVFGVRLVTCFLVVCWLTYATSMPAMALSNFQVSLL